jgi:hypothetical protein
MSIIESGSAPTPAREQAESSSPAIPPNSPQFPSAENRLNEPPPSHPPQPPAAPGDNQLTERQRTAIELLATGKSPVAVARIIEVDRKTVYNWRQDPAFREAVETLREQLWRDASARLRGLVHPSLNIIAEMLTDRFERNRVRAATLLLKMANFGKPLPPPKDPTP